jgi:hypothetical protein
LSIASAGAGLATGGGATSVGKAFTSTACGSGSGAGAGAPGVAASSGVGASTSIELPTIATLFGSSVALGGTWVSAPTTSGNNKEPCSATEIRKAGALRSL